MDIEKAKRALIRLQHEPNPGWKNREVELLNEAMLALFPGDEGDAEFRGLCSELGL